MKLSEALIAGSENKIQVCYRPTVYLDDKIVGCCALGAIAIGLTKTKSRHKAERLWGNGVVTFLKRRYPEFETADNTYLARYGTTIMGDNDCFLTPLKTIAQKLAAIGY